MSVQENPVAKVQATSRHNCEEFGHIFEMGSDICTVEGCGAGVDDEVLVDHGDPSQPPQESAPQNTPAFIGLESAMLGMRFRDLTSDQIDKALEAFADEAGCRTESEVRLLATHALASALRSDEDRIRTRERFVAYLTANGVEV
jgi:hypothetical protein